MDAESFRESGKHVIAFISNYLENIGERRVCPNVEPGALSDLFATKAPVEGLKFEAILKDIEEKIVPSIVHWQSPFFHAYFPALSSYPAVLADAIVTTFNNIGFTWASSPSCTDLEVIVLDWLAKMLDLPEVFLSQDKDGKSLPGGSIIQCTASDSVLVAVLSARTHMTERLTAIHPEENKYTLLAKFIGYQSDQTHSAFEKACRIAMIQYRTLETGPDNQLHGEDLRKAVEEDKKKGLIPIILCATLGTTSTCAFDNVKELGPICNENEIWCHVDAAYAGTAFICPEYRHLLNGVEYADSFNFNCHKWMLTGFDCSPMWFRHKMKVVKTFSQDFVMFEKHQSEGVTDFKDMQIPLGRRFRSLRLWVVLSCYGVKGLQDFVRQHCHLAQYFADLMKADDRFEVLSCRLGLVTFRLKGSNELNDAFNKAVNSDGRIHMTPTFIKGQRILRFSIGGQRTTESTVDVSWKVIQEHADIALKQEA